MDRAPVEATAQVLMDGGRGAGGRVGFVYVEGDRELQVDLRAGPSDMRAAKGEKAPPGWAPGFLTGHTTVHVRPALPAVTHGFLLCSGLCLFNQTTPGPTLQPAVLGITEIKWV